MSPGFNLITYRDKIRPAKSNQEMADRADIGNVKHVHGISENEAHEYHEGIMCFYNLICIGRLQ